MLSARGIEIGSKYVLFFWFCVPKLWKEFELWFEKKKKKKTCGIMTRGTNNLETD